MAVPDYESLMLPLLGLAAKTPNQEISLPGAVNTLAEEFSLSEEERKALLPSGNTFVFGSRVSWACTFLKKAQLLRATRRSHFQITDRGLTVLKKNPPEIDVEFLEQFEEFKEFRNAGRTKREIRLCQYGESSRTNRHP